MSSLINEETMEVRGEEDTIFSDNSRFEQCFSYTFTHKAKKFDLFVIEIQENMYI
jgi:hypothetical protein